MLYLKACPRCRGDLVLEALDYDELVCLQCSFRSSPGAVMGRNRYRLGMRVSAEGKSARTPSLRLP